MIHVHELRIGNLFKDQDGEPCYFAGAWQRQDGWILRDSAGNTYKESEIYPIELTPEILEKAGFVKTGTWYFKSPILITDKWVEIEGVNYDYNGAIVETNICQYLHQLQNLYHTLTGEELIIEI